MTRPRLLILAALIGVVAGLGREYLKLRAQSVKVQALGSLTFTFNGLPPEAPVFTVTDLKPGDCYTREVVAQNAGQSAASISVRAENINNPDQLADVLSLSLPAISYQHSLTQFFQDSTATLEGLALTSLPAGQNTTYEFTVCMPETAGNEWQKTRLVFDLVFGNAAIPTPSLTPTPSIPVPQECAPIAHSITHVFYGTEGNDRLHSGITNDLIYTYDGDDWIDASGGDDCVIAAEGNKYIRTEDGNDIIVVSGPGTNILISGSGDDLVYGGSGPDTISAGSGNDLVYGHGGDDNLDAGTGDDQVWGGEGNDTLIGKTGNDYLNGGDGTDTLTGGSGTDTCHMGELTSSCEL